jgi:hypothetical protein
VCLPGGSRRHERQQGVYPPIEGRSGFRERGVDAVVDERKPGPGRGWSGALFSKRTGTNITIHVVLPSRIFMGCKVEVEAERERDRERGRERKRKRETERKRDRQTDRQTNTQTHTHIDAAINGQPIPPTHNPNALFTLKHPVTSSLLFRIVWNSTLNPKP